MARVAGQSALRAQLEACFRTAPSEFFGTDLLATLFYLASFHGRHGLTNSIHSAGSGFTINNYRHPREIRHAVRRQQQQRINIRRRGANPGNGPPGARPQLSFTAATVSCLDL